MAQGPRALDRLGGISFIASGLLFAAAWSMGLLAGPPPSSGPEILAWAAAGRLPLALANEALFVAAVLMVPAVSALSRNLASLDRLQATVGCGLMAALIPVLMMLVIVHGRLVYSVYGLQLGSPAVAELVVAVFYGGLHATDLLLGVATFALALALRRGAHGWAVAWLGMVTGVSDVVGSYPWAVGPPLLLVSSLLKLAWFIALGAWLLGMSGEGGRGRARSPAAEVVAT